MTFTGQDCYLIVVQGYHVYVTLGQKNLIKPVVSSENTHSSSYSGFPSSSELMLACRFEINFLLIIRGIPSPDNL